jgi:Ser/Thr protein kinase RdoA (MazF antagonist)
MHRYGPPTVSRLEAQIVHELTSRYGLANCELKPLRGGWDDRARSWRIDCDPGQFVVRRDHAVSMDEAGWLADIEQRVSEAGVPCALPLAAKDGAIKFSVHAATVTLRPFLGAQLYLGDYGSDQLSAAGSVLAKIHHTDVRGLTHQPGRARPTDLFAAHRDFRRLLTDTKLDAWHREFAEQGGTGRGSVPLGRGIIHGDFWAENLRWAGNRIVAVIDWGGASLGDPARELAFSAWTLGQGEHSKLEPTRARAFLTGYSEVYGPRTPCVKEALIPLMRVCLRDYICDVVHNDDEYRAELRREFRRLREQDPGPLLEP